MASNPGVGSSSRRVCERWPQPGIQREFASIVNPFYMMNISPCDNVAFAPGSRCENREIFQAIEFVLTESETTVANIILADTSFDNRHRTKLFQYVPNRIVLAARVTDQGHLYLSDDEGRILSSPPRACVVSSISFAASQTRTKVGRQSFGAGTLA